jgi:single-strand DNA-binding protein
VAWRQTAENAADVLEKGIGVIVTGRLEQRSWEDKETGQKRSKVELVVDDIGVSARSIQGVTRRESSGDGSAKAGGGNRRPAAKQTVPDIDEEAF